LVGNHDAVSDDAHDGADVAGNFDVRRPCGVNAAVGTQTKQVRCFATDADRFAQQIDATRGIGCQVVGAPTYRI
jgi:hypothetical protein